MFSVEVLRLQQICLFPAGRRWRMEIIQQELFYHYFKKMLWTKWSLCSEHFYFIVIFLIFSFLRKVFWNYFFFYFVGIHCKFYFPYSNRLITFSPSLHNINRLRIGMQKIPKVDKKSPRGIKEGVLNLVKCERIRM